MNLPTPLTAIAASADTDAYTASWWASVALLVAFLYYVAFYDYRVGHRWKVRRGIKKAPAIDIQETQIRAIFDGNPIATIDPREFTVTVARMNGIANTYGYHYIGERGHAYGSTRIAFQFLPCSPPPRIPIVSIRRRPSPRPQVPTATHPQHFPTGTQHAGYPQGLSALNGIRAAPSSPRPDLYRATRYFFDGRDLVRVRGPLEDPVYLADIAHERGYAFAWSYMPRIRSSKNAPCFCFRRLYPAE